MAGVTQIPPGDRRDMRRSWSRAALSSRLFFHGSTDVDDVVGDHAEADPAAHSDEALVAAAPEAVSPLVRFGDDDHRNRRRRPQIAARALPEMLAASGEVTGEPLSASMPP